MIHLPTWFIYLLNLQPSSNFIVTFIYPLKTQISKWPKIENFQVPLLT